MQRRLDIMTYVSLSGRIHLFLSLSLSTCIYIYICMYIAILVGIYLPISVSLYTCIYVYLCMYLYVSSNGCVFLTASVAWGSKVFVSWLGCLSHFPIFPC